MPGPSCFPQASAITVRCGSRGTRSSGSWSGSGPSPRPRGISSARSWRDTRRLGRNPENGAIAVLAVHGERALVAILQDNACVTVLTWNQFVPRLGEFGRSRMPRKWGRMLDRLVEPPDLDHGRES